MCARCPAAEPCLGAGRGSALPGAHQLLGGALGAALAGTRALLPDPVVCKGWGEGMGACSLPLGAGVTDVGAQLLAEAVTARHAPGEVSRVQMCPGVGGPGRILVPLCLGYLQGAVFAAQG